MIVECVDIPEDIVSEIRKIHKKGAGKTGIYTETEGRFCGIFRAREFLERWAWQVKISELSRGCDLSRTTVYKYISLWRHKETGSHDWLPVCYITVQATAFSLRRILPV